MSDEVTNTSEPVASTEAAPPASPEVAAEAASASEPEQHESSSGGRASGVESMTHTCKGRTSVCAA